MKFFSNFLIIYLSNYFRNIFTFVWFWFVFNKTNKLECIQNVSVRFLRDIPLKFLIASTLVFFYKTDVSTFFFNCSLVILIDLSYFFIMICKLEVMPQTLSVSGNFLEFPLKSLRSKVFTPLYPFYQTVFRCSHLNITLTLLLHPAKLWTGFLVQHHPAGFFWGFP